MRICLISREFPPDTGWGGIATFVHDLALGLAEVGQDVEVIALSANGQDSVIDYQGVKVHRVAPRPLEQYQMFLSVMPYSHSLIKALFALHAKFLELHEKNPFDVVEVPEKKRKIIGRDFVEVFDAAAKKITDAKWLAQGTIYPDRIESLSITGMVIKSHHNVGGLPEEMNLKLCEPLKWLFKDEVRRVGRQMQMPERLINRHPFPGPGLAVRILGDITREKVRILQEADDIYIETMHEWKDTDGVFLYDKVWQAGAVLLSTVRSVGVMGDERTYENPVALRAVTSMDAMTADWAHLPYEFLAKVSNDIINKVKGVNRVCYDISSKPPSTIEWE